MALPATASAAPVLVVAEHGQRLRSEPVPVRASRLPIPSPAARPSIAPRVTESRVDAVRRAVSAAAARDRIDATDKRKYLGNYSAALRAYRSLGGQRRSELGYVIGVAQSLARSGRLEPSRMPIVFLTLHRNTEWWRKAGPPPSGRRIQFGGSRVIFQYFPGRGLQFHPLGNFGLLNGYWYDKKDQNLRSLADDLVSIAAVRAGFTTWEYYFAFGGGSPPWISGMAQGTAMQALSRAGVRLGDSRLLAVARRARGAFARRTPVGVRVPTGSGAWYALYSFDPHMNVLNGQLQAVNGLRTYAEHANDARAQQLFETGDRLARSVIRSFDTGAWSLYSRPFGRSGGEADLNYHTLNRDFARNLCKGTKSEAYCDEADRFTRYLKEDPEFEPYRAVPSPARAGRGMRVKFHLSKIAKVAFSVREGGKTYYSTSATLARGAHFFRWVPPRFKSEHTYTFRLSARDLAGNGNTVDGEARVKP
ncbi:MAG: D-glucuronyl C5-epimerase family protein [Solirubrobacterales bacterium]